MDVLGGSNCRIGDKAADASPLSLSRTVHKLSFFSRKIDEDLP